MAVAPPRGGIAPSSDPSLGSGLLCHCKCGLRVLARQDDEHGCLFGYYAEGPTAWNAVDMGRGGAEVGDCGRDIGARGGLGPVFWIYPALMFSTLDPLSDLPHEMIRPEFESARTRTTFDSDLLLTSAVAAVSLFKMP